MTRRPLMGVVVPAHGRLSEHERNLAIARHQARLDELEHVVAKAAMAHHRLRPCKQGCWEALQALHDACAALDAAEKGDAK